ncbi:MAG: tRNA dihydrouridine synthase DusB [Methylacidiphilales bacterium]|nr:tRNA dihydrouridine synthase DusB [Candidatus Methylacidiphilales bacterium]MDW8349948.1 tRNA dihydrouridine synthase DusB [Verrucomicrobiae bacterium]
MLREVQNKIPTLKIGGHLLSSPLVLSPLAGYTNLPFRILIREIGGVGLCTTDLVNARSLIERNPKALRLIRSCEKDRPLAIQLFGSVAHEMAEAARICEDAGAFSVDINMGCPVRKVCQVGGGSAMMREHQHTAKIVREMIRAVKIPVTAKMRLGWDEDNITAPDLARVLRDEGIAAITVHGRTRSQGFGGKVNLSGIRQVVEAVPEIPVIGNGDVTTPLLAEKMWQATGCAGIGIGRGAFYNPWIFLDTLHYIKSGELRPEVSFEERVRVMRRHLDLMVEVFGEELGCKMFRKIGPWYARRFGPCSVFNKAIVQLHSRRHFEEILGEYIAWRSQFLDENGELLPRYKPAEFEDTLVEDNADSTDKTEVASQNLANAGRRTIPVPKGPVEVW